MQWDPRLVLCKRLDGGPGGTSCSQLALLTIRVNAVEGGGGDDGDLILPQGALLAQLLPASTVNLMRGREEPFSDPAAGSAFWGKSPQGKDGGLWTWPSNYVGSWPLHSEQKSTKGNRLSSSLSKAP